MSRVRFSASTDKAVKAFLFQPGVRCSFSLSFIQRNETKDWVVKEINFQGGEIKKVVITCQNSVGEKKEGEMKIEIPQSEELANMTAQELAKTLADGLVMTCELIPKTEEQYLLQSAIGTIVDIAIN